MQSTGVEMEKKKKSTHKTEMEDHTRMTEGPEMSSTGDNHQLTNKTKEFRKYKRIGCMRLCSVPLPATFDIKTFELGTAAGLL